MMLLGYLAAKIKILMIRYAIFLSISITGTILKLNSTVILEQNIVRAIEEGNSFLSPISEMQ